MVIINIVINDDDDCGCCCCWWWWCCERCWSKPSCNSSLPPFSSAHQRTNHLTMRKAAQYCWLLHIVQAHLYTLSGTWNQCGQYHTSSTELSGKSKGYKLLSKIVNMGQNCMFLEVGTFFSILQSLFYGIVNLIVRPQNMLVFKKDKYIRYVHFIVICPLHCILCLYRCGIVNNFIVSSNHLLIWSSTICFLCEAPFQLSILDTFVIVIFILILLSIVASSSSSSDNFSIMIVKGMYYANPRDFVQVLWHRSVHWTTHQTIYWTTYCLKKSYWTTHQKIYYNVDYTAFDILSSLSGSVSRNLIDRDTIFQHSK